MRGAIFGLIASVLLTGQLLAQGLGPQQRLGPQKAAPPAPQAPAGAIKPKITQCFTDVTDCAGLAPFAAGDANWSCTIFWDNGATGHSNFTLRSGDTAYYHVIYNDTAACVQGLNGGSETASRYYIWVP